MFTVKQVAQKLNLSIGSVYKAIQSGALGHYRFGTAIRVTEEQLSEYLENVRVLSESQPMPVRRFKHL
jgi:excisionase family DNA binding protein